MWDRESGRAAADYPMRNILADQVESYPISQDPKKEQVCGVFHGEMMLSIVYSRGGDTETNDRPIHQVGGKQGSDPRIWILWSGGVGRRGVSSSQIGRKTSVILGRMSIPAKRVPNR